MSTPPQAILDALQAVQNDADMVVSTQAQSAISTAAAAAAQLQATNDAAAVTAAIQHEATDLAALQALLTQTYGGGPAVSSVKR